jgi:hypothetical protein
MEIGGTIIMEIKLEVLGGVIPKNKTYFLKPKNELEKRIKSFEASGFKNQNFDPFLVDEESYTLTITTQGSERKYKIHEGLVSPDVLDLLDDIIESSNEWMA